MAKNKKILLTMLSVWTIVDAIRTLLVFFRARGFYKENDKQLLINAINRLAGHIAEPDEVVRIDNTKLHVSYNPYMQWMIGNLGDVAVVLNGTTEVYVDEQFRSLSPMTQRAILSHELGHNKLGHQAVPVLYQLERTKAILSNQVIPMELEADKYACGIVGRKAMIKALREMQNIKSISKKELKLRIKHIKNVVK